jgi:hypothetical protein
MARTAVVAGTATAVSNRVSRRQANRWAQQGEAQPAYMQPGYPQPAYAQPAYAQPVQPAYAQPAQPAYAPAPAPPAAQSTEEKLALLKQLGELKTAGVLTDAEFEAQKARILPL